MALFTHATLERNVTLMGLAALVTVAIGGIVEIAPLFWIDNTVEKVEPCALCVVLASANRRSAILAFIWKWTCQFWVLAEYLSRS